MIGTLLFGSDVAYGNSGLWVGGLGGDGVIRIDASDVEADGSMSWKFGWYRVTPGQLSITGHRLDANVAPLHAEVPDGYGPSGFQASGVFFPTAGCWEVTGKTDTAQLTFVTLVTLT